MDFQILGYASDQAFGMSGPLDGPIPFMIRMVGLWLAVNLVLGWLTMAYRQAVAAYRRLRRG